MPGTVAALVVAASLTGQSALADEGLATGARSRYVLDAEATTVDAEVTIDLRNDTPDQGSYYYFFDSFSVPVPAGAEDVRARSGGSDLAVSLRPTDDPSTRLARISFPNLLFGRSRTIVLTYEVPGEKPRSEDSTRVGPGYATFAVHGLGEAGRSTVEVVAPASMTFDATSDEFTSVVNGALTTHTTTATSTDGGYWAVVSLRDPEKGDELTVDVSGVSLVLNGFEDDPKWADFVAGQVTKGLPTLEALVGTPWPGGLERIREDATPSLRGYDGWFDPSGDEIVVGERLDADLIFHELSHAWVSGDRFDERWVSEGLAQVLAERTVAATGGRPGEHPTVSRGADEAVALNEWGGSAGSRSADVDAYAYPASYTATRALLADLQGDDLAAVIGAALRGERAYDPAGTPDAEGGRTSWSRWLDLLETRGGVQDAPEVLSRWALTGEQQAQLPPRAEARTAYAAVDEADGAWLPPEGLRDAMTGWDFERAASVRDKIDGLPEDAKAVQDAASRAGVAAPALLREAYEKAEHDEQYVELATSLRKAAAAVPPVALAQRDAAQGRDPVSTLGATVLGVQDRATRAATLLEDGSYDEARAAAEQATNRADLALLVGLGLVLTVLLVLAATAWLGWRGVSTSTRRRRAAHATAEAERAPLPTPLEASPRPPGD
ncbi:MAG TPA: hypothetical protein VLQ78_04925 [Ornithinibacter sp.]|nr:hypothetical protein [Ornithinibacter sp.]